MTIYYIKQDNAAWCCEEDSGPYYEEIETSFVKCECAQIEPETMEEHLQNHKGLGKVLKWRKATEEERSAWFASGDDFFEEGIKFERERIIALLKEQHVLRNCGATGLLVFVDCTNLEVLYLKDDLLNEVAA